MPVMQQGQKLRLLVDGVHQLLQSDIQLQVDGQNQPLEVIEGLVGFTHGPGRVTITGTGVVPRGGPEFDYVDAAARRSFHDLQVPYGTKSYIGNGLFDQATLGASTGKGTEISFTWIGEFTPPK